MEKNPRYVEIDYAKYAPDIPEDQLEAYYGLPKHVQFCNECVMSNQKPNSCYEFEHTIKSGPLTRTDSLPYLRFPAAWKATLESLAMSIFWMKRTK